MRLLCVLNIISYDAKYRSKFNHPILEGKNKFKIQEKHSNSERGYEKAQERNSKGFSVSSSTGSRDFLNYRKI